MTRTQIKYIFQKWFNKEEEESVKKEKFVSNIISTNAFLKMSLQEKMLSLGKLITMFRAENGYTPKALERAMEDLNKQMNHETIRNWNANYSS